MHYFIIEGFSLDKALVPSNILNGYVAILNQATSSSDFFRESLSVYKKAKPKNKLMLRYDCNHNHWVIAGSLRTAFQNARLIKLGSPYLSLLVNYHDRYQSGLPMIGFALKSLHEPQYDRVRVMIKKSALLSKAVADCIHHLNSNQSPTIVSIIDAIWGVRELLVRYVSNDSDSFWRLRPEHKAHSFVIHEYENTSRSFLYEYFVEKMLKRFVDSVYQPSLKRCKNHTATMTAEQISYEQSVGGSTDTYSEQDSLQAVSLSAYSSLFQFFYPVEADLASDENLIHHLLQGKTINVRHILSSDGWEMDMINFDTSNCHITDTAFKNQEFFKRLVRFSSYETMDPLMTHACQISKRRKVHLNSTIVSEIYTALTKTKRKYLSKKHSDNIASELLHAAVMRVQYESFTDLKFSLIALMSTQKNETSPEPKTKKIASKLIEIVHPKLCLPKLDQMLKEIRILLNGKLEHSPKSVLISRVSDFLFELAYQSPLLAGIDLFGEVLGQSLFYLISKRYHDTNLACYWGTHKGASWDMMALGCILEETFQSGPEKFFLNGMSTYISSQTHPWSQYQQIFTESQLNAKCS